MELSGQLNVAAALPPWKNAGPQLIEGSVETATVLRVLGKEKIMFELKKYDTVELDATKNR